MVEIRYSAHKGPRVYAGDKRFTSILELGEWIVQELKNDWTITIVHIFIP